jgi:hypothetical protein
VKHQIKRQIPVLTLIAVLALALSLTVATHGILSGVETNPPGSEMPSEGSNLIEFFEPEDIPLADPSLIGVEAPLPPAPSPFPGLLIGLAASVGIIPLSTIAFKLFTGTHK